MSEGNFWENKIKIAKGTLLAFEGVYDSINAKEGQYCTASQLFPTGGRDKESNMLYEFVIYYKRNPNQDNKDKSLNKESGKVERVEFDKEGRVQLKGV